VDQRKRIKAINERARELAAQGRHHQTIVVLLEMEGFLEAAEVLSDDLTSELKALAEETRKV